MQSRASVALAASLISVVLALSGPAAGQDSAQDAREAIRQAGQKVGEAIREAAKEMRRAADETKRELKAALEEARMFTESEAVKATIVAWTQALIDEKYGTWITFWTEDALLMPPGHAALEGRDQILSYAREKFPHANNFSFSDWHVEGRGDLVVVTNHIVWGESRFKQMLALRRENDEWRIQTVMFNAGVAE